MKFIEIEKGKLYFRISLFLHDSNPGSREDQFVVSFNVNLGEIKSHLSDYIKKHLPEGSWSTWLG